MKTPSEQPFNAMVATAPEKHFLILGEIAFILDRTGITNGATTPCQIEMAQKGRRVWIAILETAT